MSGEAVPRRYVSRRSYVCSSGKAYYREAWKAELALTAIAMAPTPGRRNAISFYRCDECLMYHLTSHAYGTSKQKDDRHI